MRLYHVKHAGGDHRLHQPDGTELGTFVSDPRDGNRPVEQHYADVVADNYPGASLLGNPDARAAYTAAVTGAVDFRNVAEHGPDEVPFQL